MSASAICAERPAGAETGPIRDEAIAWRLTGCGEALREHALLWRSVAFRERRPAWEAVLPELAAALRALRLEQVEALHADPRAAQAWLARWLPLDAVAGLEEVGAWPRIALRPWPSGFASTVPGRKWRQIEGNDYYVPGEVCDSIAPIRQDWFWLPDDQPRPMDQLIKQFHWCRTGGANYLLNVPPDRRGVIPQSFVAALQELRKLMNV